MKKIFIYTIISLLVLSSVYGFLGISFIDPNDVLSRNYTLNCTDGCDNFGNVTNIYNNVTFVSNDFDQSLNTTDNVNFANVTTTGFFSGIFNWFVSTVSQKYLSFNGTILSFNEAALNTTINDIASGINATSSLVFEENGNQIQLINDTGITLFNLSGISANFLDINIENTSSLTFDNGKYKISAEDFVFPVMFLANMSNASIIRRQIVTDSDFQVRHNISNSTAFLSVFNQELGIMSKASVSLVNDIGVGAAITKSSSTFYEPNILEFNNNGGNFDIIVGPRNTTVDQPTKGGLIRIGSYENFTLTTDLGIKVFENKFYGIIINYTSGVIIDADLIVNGTLSYNEVFGELYFPENGDLNVTINTIDTYYNVTPLYNGYNSSIGLGSSKFIIQEDGTYFGSYTGSMKDGSNSDFGLAIFVNNQEQNRTHAHFTTLTSNRYTNFAGQGTFSAVEGDVINLRVQDESNPASDADFNNINFIIRRIGKV